MGGGAQRRSVGTAVGRLLAVFDRPADADAATQALAAEAGIDNGRIDRYEGAADAPLFDASGRRRGLRGRLYRIIEFTWADQAPDFAWYEAALRGGPDGPVDPGLGPGSRRRGGPDRDRPRRPLREPFRLVRDAGAGALARPRTRRARLPPPL